MNDARSSAALSCRNVVEGGAPIRYVSRDHDGDWQVLCGGDEHGDDEEARVLHLEHLIERDASLLEVADLPFGAFAERLDVGSPWVRGTSDDDRQHPEVCSCGRAHDRTVGPDGFDADERRCVENVTRFGLHIWQIEPGDDDDGFAYSVGLFHSYAHPEIVVFGQRPSWQAAMLNAMAERIRNGERFREGVVYTDLIEGFNCRFRTVRSRESLENYLGWDLWFYATVDPRAELVPVLQFVWPDTRGNDPGSAEYSGYRQPLIP